MKLLPVVVLLAACAAPKRFDPDAVTRVLDAQAAAWNRGDLAGYMAGYVHGDALVFTSGGKVRTGWQTTFDTYKARYGSAPDTMGKLRFDILRVDPVGTDAAVVLGRWILTESEHPGSGIFSVVLARGAGGWRIVHDHTSSDAP